MGKNSSVCVCVPSSSESPAVPPLSAPPRLSLRGRGRGDGWGDRGGRGGRQEGLSVVIRRSLESQQALLQSSSSALIGLKVTWQTGGLSPLTEPQPALLYPVCSQSCFYYYSFICHELEDFFFPSAGRKKLTDRILFFFFSSNQNDLTSFWGEKRPGEKKKRSTAD